jgi:hypothetical protein
MDTHFYTLEEFLTTSNILLYCLHYPSPYIVQLYKPFYTFITQCFY